MIVAGLAGTLIYKWLKGATERPRPYQACPTICCLTAPLDRFSFPSGHTLHAVVFSLVATAYYPALGWLVWPFTALVAASRLVLGLHYVMEVEITKMPFTIFSSCTNGMTAYEDKHLGSKRRFYGAGGLDRASC